MSPGKEKGTFRTKEEQPEAPWNKCRGSSLGSTKGPGKQEWRGPELSSADGWASLCQGRQGNLCLKLAALSCRGHWETFICCRPSCFFQGKSVKLLSVGRERKNVALCPAYGLGPWPSYLGTRPRSCGQEPASPLPGPRLGTGAPLHSLPLRT